MLLLSDVVRRMLAVQVPASVTDPRHRGALRSIRAFGEAKTAELPELVNMGRGISTTRLAALGGVSDSRVRQLVLAGDLNVDKAHDVRPKDAIRWLAARGVPGFR